MTAEAPAGPQNARQRGRPRVEDEVPVEAMLDTALTAFATFGYGGVSVRTLNRELGVSHSLINQRFGSKAGLWRAAIDHGFGGLASHMESVFDPTLTDPLDQLKLAIREFLMFSAAHPELLGLMEIESRQSTDRLDYIYDTYIAPTMAGTERLLSHLIEHHRVRPIRMRTLHFLMTHGGAAPFTHVPLAQRFDPASPVAPGEVKAHAELIASILIAGIRTDNPPPAPHGR